MSINLDISFLTSDNSHFDDFSDSDQAKGYDLQQIPDASPPSVLCTPTNQQQLDKDSFANLNNSFTTISSTDLVTDFQQSDSANNKDDAEDFLNQIHNAETENPIPGHYKQEVAPSCSTSSNLSTPNMNRDPKNVDDDILIQALFLCEKNYNPPGTKTDETVTASTPQTDDKYANLDEYLDIVCNTSEKNIPQQKDVQITPTHMKPYSSENPHGSKPNAIHVTFVPLPKKRYIKRINHNRKKLHEIHMFNQKNCMKKRSEQSTMELYNNFKMYFENIELNRRKKRVLSTDSTGSSHKKNKKVKRVISCKTNTTFSCTNSKSGMKVCTKVQKRHSVVQSKKDTVESNSPIAKLPNDLTYTNKEGNRNKRKESKIHKDIAVDKEFLCNPYQKFDPDFRPSSVALRRKPGTHIFENCSVL